MECSVSFWEEREVDTIGVVFQAAAWPAAAEEEDFRLLELHFSCCAFRKTEICCPGFCWGTTAMINVLLG